MCKIFLENLELVLFLICQPRMLQHFYGIFFDCSRIPISLGSLFETKLIKQVIFLQLGEENPETKRLQKQHASMNNSIRTKYLSLTNKRTELTTAFKQMYELYKEVQHVVLEKQLIQWKREQQLAGNGYDVNIGQLEVLQVKFVCLTRDDSKYGYDSNGQDFYLKFHYQYQTRLKTLQSSLPDKVD